MANKKKVEESEVNAPGATVNEDEGKELVQPLETVEDKVPVLKGERCWNCYAQDRKTKNRLDENGVCDACGFQKGLLYNGTIEADKAAQRAEAARVAERGQCDYKFNHSSYSISDNSTDSLVSNQYKRKEII